MLVLKLFVLFHLLIPCRGVEENIADTPFLVRVYVHKHVNKTINICTGVYIHLKWVLVAGHCVQDISSNHIDCCMGEEAEDYIEGCREYRSVEKIVVPNGTQPNDFKLLKLRTPFELKDNIEMGRLVLEGMGNVEALAWTRCMAFGWKKFDDPDTINKFLLKTNVTVANVCPRDKYICTFSLSSGICIADSGSPLICSGSIVGLATGGNITSGSCDIGPTGYVEYVELDKYIDSISSIINESYERYSANTDKVKLKHQMSLFVIFLIFKNIFA